MTNKVGLEDLWFVEFQRPCGSRAACKAVIANRGRVSAVFGQGERVDRGNIPLPPAALAIYPPQAVQV